MIKNVSSNEDTRVNLLIYVESHLIYFQYGIAISFSAVIGELDDETDNVMDLHNIRAEPLNPIVH